MSMKTEENELLVRVGSGTPMGDVMRHYWHPIATIEELHAPDSDPKRVRLLGENFVLFRNSDGVLGLLDELCMHRQASLALGRVEDNGIRCLYHGWKFAVDGQVMDTPNVADANYKKSRSANAYPVVEDSGMIWTYIGPKDKQPPFRHFASSQADEVLVFNFIQRANYLQTWEGGLDSSHVTMLHTNQARPAWGASRSGATSDAPQYTPLNDFTPRFEVEDTEFGYHYAAIRNAAEAGMENIRVTPAMFPTGRFIPGPQGGTFDFLVWETPIDDYSTSTFLCLYGEGKIDREDAKAMLGFDDSRVWTEHDVEIKVDWSNNFTQDRKAMRGANWTGLKGICVEDAAMSVSMGAILDRTKEHLVPADMAVVKVRRRLREAVELVRQGNAPFGVRIQDMTSVRPLEAVVAKGTSWKELAAANRAVGK